MVERSLRGMKIGANSLESEVGVALVSRFDETYICENGHKFTITFATDADVPQTWECRCGSQAQLVGDHGSTGEEKSMKPVRTHWDMLLERRSEEELNVLLKERLELLRAGKLYSRKHS